MATEIIVKKDDCLSKYAKTYGVSVNDIAKANGLSDPDKIKIGQKLIIPDPVATEATGLDTVSFKKTAPVVKPTVEEKPAETTTQKETKFIDTMKKHLDIPTAELSFHKSKNGKKYLKISRPNDVETKDSDYTFGKIKDSLKLKNKVLYENNGERQGVSLTAGVYDAGQYDMNKLSIRPGRHVFVPLDEIGQKQEEKGFLIKEKFDSAKNIELKEAVENL